MTPIGNAGREGDPARPWFRDPHWLVPLILASAYAVLGMALSLRYSPLGDQAVEADFFAELAPAAQKLVAGDFAVTNYPFKGPVYSFLLAAVHAPASLFGLGWYRSGVLLSLLASGTALVLLFRMARHLVGRLAAFVVFVLTSATSVFFVHATKASSDMVFLLFVVGAQYALLTRPAGRGTCFAAGVCGGLAFLTRYIGAVVPVWGLAVILLLDLRRTAWSRRLRAASWFLAGCTAVALPWLVVSYAETGSLLRTGNLQNVVTEFYGDEAAHVLPAGTTDSLGALIGHDPGHFVGHYLGNIGRHARRDFEEITAPVFGILALAGFLTLIRWRPDRRLVALLAFGGVYFLALCTVFYLPRFSLALVPVHAFLVALLLERVPRWRTIVAVIAVGAVVVLHGGYNRRALAYYHAQQPIHLRGAIELLGEVARHAGERPLSVMARKAHIAHYAGMEYRPYPGLVTSAAGLLRAAAEREADYLVVGIIEREHLGTPGILDRLHLYEGTELVYEDDLTRVFGLDPAGEDYGIRPDIVEEGTAWWSIVEAGQAGQFLPAALELADDLSGDGELEWARDVMAAAHASPEGRRDPTTALYLSWLHLRLAEAEAGIAVLATLRDEVPEIVGTPVEAHFHGLLGRLQGTRGDTDAARAAFERARKLYEDFGAADQTRAIEAEIENLGPE